MPTEKSGREKMVEWTEEYWKSRAADVTQAEIECHCSLGDLCEATLLRVLRDGTATPEQQRAAGANWGYEIEREVQRQAAAQQFMAEVALHSGAGPVPPKGGH